MKIPVAKPYFGEEEVENVTRVMKEGWIARGKELDIFEEKLAKYFDVKYAVLVSSGTDALEVAFRSLNIKGKEIITSATSCSPSANGILRSENKVVFVDVNPKTFCIDPDKIEEHITSRTVAIMPIHIYGRPCQMDKIMQIAKKYNLYVVEDCAQSMGAKFNNKLTGTFGDIGCFSLNINKIITTGEGGFIITNDDKIAERAKILRNYGREFIRTDYCYTMYGANFKLTNIQAAIGLAQMNKIDEIIKKRRENGYYYTKLLKQIKGIQIYEEGKNEYGVFFCMPILLKKEGIRDDMRKFLEDKGIENRTLFVPMSKQPYFEEMFGVYPEEFPIAEKIGQSGLYVSCSPGLTKEEIKEIVLVIKSGLDEFE